MPYSPFSVLNRVHKLPHTDSCVITECNIMHYNKSCRFFFFSLYSFRIWQIKNPVLNWTCIKHIMYSLLRITHAWTVLYVGILIQSIFLFTVQNYGARELADLAQWRKLGCFSTDFYAEITSCRQTSWHLKGYAWTDLAVPYIWSVHFTIRGYKVRFQWRPPRIFGSNNTISCKFKSRNGVEIN